MNKRNVIIGAVALLLAFGAGYYATPTKVKTEFKQGETKTVTVKQDVVKIVYKERVTNPDGTIIERETTKEQTNTDARSDETKTTESSTVTEKDTGLVLSALAISDINNLNEREYGVHVTKRVFSNINVGVLATTDKKIGVSVGVSF